MQNAKIGKTTKGPLHGLTHAGTITLSDGTKFTPADIQRDPAKVMVSIIRQQRSLYSKSIEDWIMARAQAENPIYPIRTLLYDIYEDIMLDAFIHGLIYNHRILPVKNKAFKIVNGSDGKSNPEKTKLFKKSWMDKFMQFAMESVFFSYSLPYFDEMQVIDGVSYIKKLVLVDRKHVHQERQVVTVFQTDLTGTDYTQEPVSNYVIPIGDPCSLGLLNKAVPLAILKKHGWQNWDEFGEVFGMPIRIAKTASQDPRVQNEIETWLREMSTASYGIFPQDTEIDIKESTRSDAFQVFNELIKAANEELAILICGQTMTSMNGSSKSQGEVHERVMLEIVKDDEKFIHTIINEQLLPLLREKHKYPLKDGDSFEWDQPEDLQDLLTIYKGVDALGFQTDPVEVSERFGVKIIGLKPRPGAAPPDDEQDNEPDPKKEQPKKKKAKNPTKEQTDDEELHIGAELIKLHAAIHKLYSGSNVHQV